MKDNPFSWRSCCFSCYKASMILNCTRSMSCLNGTARAPSFRLTYSHNGNFCMLARSSFQTQRVPSRTLSSKAEASSPSSDETVLKTLMDGVDQLKVQDATLDVVSSGRPVWPLFALGATVGVIYAVAAPFLTIPIKRQSLGGVPYLSTFPARLQTVFSKLDDYPHLKGAKLVDMGSGDGRVVLEACARGYQAVGVEINPYLFLISKWKARTQGCSDKVKFLKQNFFHYDLRETKVVVIYGIDDRDFMRRMKEKLEAELPQDAVVLSNTFRIYGWNPTGPSVNGVYVYVRRDQTPQS